MEQLRAPDGTVKSFGPRLAAYYKDRGWTPTAQPAKKASAKKSTAKKSKTGSVTDDQPDTGKTQE